MTMTAGVDTGRTVGQRAIQLLSTVPYFDLDTGADIVSLLADPIDDRDRRSWASNFLFELAGTGLIEPVRDLHRVPETFRDAESAVAVSMDGDTVSQALTIFVDRAESSMKKSLSMLMGLRGRKVVVQTLRVAAAPDESSSFDELIDTLHRSSRLGRSQDSRAAARLLRSYTDAEDRRLTFLEGLSYWQAGQRSESAPLFQAVLDFKIKDKADAIAAHLLGVHQHEVDKSPEALTLFSRSEGTLKRLPDYRGLAITRTSFARVLRDLATPDVDETGLKKAIAKFQEARASLNRVSNTDVDDWNQSLGRIELGEGQARFLLGERDEAFKMVRRAAELLRASPEQELLTHIVLARMYRDTDDAVTARDILSSYVERVEASGPSWQLAQGLNVLASIERRMPETLQYALENAAQSVEIGEYLGDKRHVAHALITLANIEIDLLQQTRLRSPAEARRVRSHLYRARSMLRGDQRSAEMVEDALQRLDGLRVEL